jgi:hypothetical protein
MSQLEDAGESTPRRETTASWSFGFWLWKNRDADGVVCGRTNSKTAASLQMYVRVRRISVSSSIIGEAFGVFEPVEDDPC